MTDRELREAVERAAAEAKQRDRHTYQGYAYFCEVRGITPPSFERWQVLRTLHAFND